MPLLNFGTPSQSDMEKAALLKSRNNAPILSPKEKFDLHIKRTIGHNKRAGVYHFKAIENGAEIVLFNGLGEKLGVFINNFHGQRECRNFAFSKYDTERHSENIVGGYKYDFVNNL